MTGEIDEVRVWKGVRTQQQVAENMNSSVPAPQSTLAAYWPINPGGTTTLEDASGNGNDITLNGGYTSGNWNSTGAMTSPAGSGYRYGFNGKEMDKDMHSQTAYDYGFRIYTRHWEYF